MAITTSLCNSAKKEFLSGAHLPSHTYKIALIKVGATGTYDATITSYNLLGGEEATGTGYTAGGTSCGAPIYNLNTGTGSLDFNNVTWSSATLSAIGAIIYNSSVAGNPALGVFDFGGTVASTNADFTVQLPTGGTGEVFRIS